MDVEVIFRDKISGYKPDEVATLEYGPFLKAILLSEKAEVLNPPDFNLETMLKKEAEDEGSSKHEADRGEPPKAPDSSKGTRKKSEPNPSETTGDST